MAEEKVIGVDIGGTHITAAVVDLGKRTIVPGTQHRANVNAQGTVEQVLEAWCAVIQKTAAAYPVGSIRLGISMPGPFDYEQGICQFQNQSKYDSLYGLNVKELLASRLSCAASDIRMANDAGCFLRGEVFGGAASQVVSAIGLTLGTGLGSATLRQGVAQDADLWRSPFKEGIAEEYLSTRAFVQAYKRLCGRQVADVKALTALYPYDSAAQQAFSVFADDLALFLAPYLKELAPEVVIIGGNIANAWDLFVPLTVEKLATLGLHVPFRRAVLAEEAALLGAASYWHAESPKPILTLNSIASTHLNLPQNN